MQMGDDEAPVVAAKTGKSGPSTVMLLLLGFLLVVMAVGGAAGAMVYLSRHGLLGAVSGGGEATGPGAAVAAAKKDAAVGIHPKAIEPLLINLADEGGHAYLRVALVLEEEDSPAGKGKDAKEDAKAVAGADALVKDTIFDVMGRQTSGALLAPDGKEKAKAALKSAIAASSPDLRVRTIYFTDFLVQR